MLRGLLGGLLFSINAMAADLYVSPNGSDSNSGTTSAPFRTIQKAANSASAGTTVHVAPGTYAEEIFSTKSGTASARIRFVSTTRWGAKIVPPSSGKGYAWDNRGSYVDIEGFEVDGRNNPLWVGGIYTGGSYTTIKFNHVHHIGTSPTCSSQGGSGIGTDHYYYGVNSDVIGNVVHHIGSPTCNFIQGLYISTTGNVKNNLVYQVGAVAIHLWHDARDIVIANNTVFSSGTGIVIGGGEYYHFSGPTDNVHVSNNIIFDNQYGISEFGQTGRNNTYTNNLVYGNSSYNWKLLNGLTHTGTITADPQFVNYIRTGGGDYRLKSTSPAVDKGSTRYSPSTDLAGLARPQGSAPDIGAYEFVATAPSPTPVPVPVPAPTPTPGPVPSPSPSISVSPTQVVPGSIITVNVNGPGATVEEYVAFYLASSPDSDWAYKGNWVYLNGTKTTPASPIKSATLKFVAPMEPGVYNIRFFSSDNFTQAGNRLAMSTNITVKEAAIPQVDVTDPAVQISAPINGDTYRKGSGVTVTATATDNVGVTKVEFYVNGSLKCTDTAAPYSCAFTTAKFRRRQYKIQTKAYDAAGNSGLSQVVLINTY